MNDPASGLKRRIVSILDWTLRLMGAASIAIAVCAALVSYRFHEVSPPREMRSIRDFKLWRPDLTDAVRISVRGSTYFAIKGPYARPLPSDHSEFYFDSQGNFLTWNRDIGDVFEPRMLHPGSSPREAISISDIPDGD